MIFDILRRPLRSLGTRAVVFLLCLGVGATLTVAAPRLLAAGALNLGALRAIAQTRSDEPFVEQMLWGAGLRAFSVTNKRGQHNLRELTAVWHLPSSADECLLNDSTESILRWAVGRDSSLFLGWRLLARHYSCQGRAEEALEALERACAAGGAGPYSLVWLEMGDLYDRMGEPSRAIQAYKRARYLGRTDQAIVQYSEVAASCVAEGRDEAAAAMLDRGLRLMPGNLCLLYNRYSLAMQVMRRTDSVAQELRDRLLHFDQDAIAPNLDPRLTVCNAETMAGLVEEGIWSHDTLVGVVSYRVWRYADRDTEQFVRALLEFFPEDVDIHFYLGELYQRLEAWDEARAAYERAIAIQPSYAAAYLRLGIVLQETCGEALRDCDALAEIEDAYVHYVTLMPDDLLGLKKLADLYVLSQNAKAVQLSSELNKRSDDLQIVSELLGLPAEQISLGPNLIANAGFEVWLPGRPEWWWQWWIWGRERINEGLLVAGPDDIEAFAGDQAARMQGLWVDTDPNLGAPQIAFTCNDDARATRCDYALSPTSIYVFSCYYRTVNVEENAASAWFGSGADLPFAGMTALAPTDGEWRRVLSIATNAQSHRSRIRLTLQLRDKGEVWWDDVTLRQVSVGVPLSIEEVPTGVWLR